MACLRLICLALCVLLATRTHAVEKAEDTGTPAATKAQNRINALNDALILLDPHAGSADKFDACVHLRKAGADDAALAIPALARQSKYDQPHIRLLALETLNLLVGEREAALLRQTIGDGDEAREAMATWIGSLRIWSGIGSARPADALAAALLLWNKSHGVSTEGFPNLYPQKRSRLIEGLVEGYPALGARRRKLALQLMDALDRDHPIAVSVALNALADADPDVRALAQKSADKLFTAGACDPIVIMELVRTVTEPKPAPGLNAVADQCLDTMGPAARSMAIDLTLARMVEGYPEALFTLVSWSALDAPLARVVIRLGKLPPHHQGEIARFLRDLAVSPEVVQLHATSLLCAEDSHLREQGANLIAAAGERVDRHAALIDALGQGKRQSLLALQRLDLDPAVVNPQIVPLLASRITEVRLAACSVLRVTGLTGDGVRPAVEALLIDLDDDVCIAAAELLGRQDILTWMRIPPLLRELRSDEVVRRMIAARQLDELDVEPKEITSALRRAVDRRDMAVREGLINALESAHVKRRTTLEMLDQTASQQDDPTSRAYARAALREIASGR